jgi:DNA-binding MarR family transcriptional regulator/GNAT superfamily N-acetyltransferase
MAQRSRHIEAIRRFNRSYTQKIGVLDEGLLNSPYSLTEVRVLFEIAHRPGVLASDLERDLALDAGYLSRILARLVKKRLLVRQRSTDDGRRRPLRLSAAGEQVFSGLDACSSEQVERLIEHLPVVDRDRLVGLLGSVDALLTQSNALPKPVDFRGLRSGDLGWVVERHGVLYGAEYGWNLRFEALVARIVAEYLERHQPGRENAWIAEIEGQAVGCVFLVRETEEEAKLRLLLVEPSARGRGIGKQLVDRCIAFAREAGYSRLTLWTNSVLTAARRIYEQAGFQMIKSEEHTDFGPKLEGQVWELRLR